jgi:hypothetical protein
VFFVEKHPQLGVTATKSAILVELTFLSLFGIAFPSKGYRTRLLDKF